MKKFTYEYIDNLRRRDKECKLLLTVDTSGNSCGIGIFAYNITYREALLVHCGVLKQHIVRRQSGYTGDIMLQWARSPLFDWDMGTTLFPWIIKCRVIAEAILDLHEQYMFDDIVIEGARVNNSPAGLAAVKSGALMKLGMVSAFLADAFRAHYAKTFHGRVHIIPPIIWKGTVPKRVTMHRMRDRWRWRGTDHNEADAIGIGDYVLREMFNCWPILPEKREYFV